MLGVGPGPSPWRATGRFGFHGGLFPPPFRPGGRGRLHHGARRGRGERFFQRVQPTILTGWRAGTRPGSFSNLISEPGVYVLVPDGLYV